MCPTLVPITIKGLLCIPFLSFFLSFSLRGELGTDGLNREELNAPQAMQHANVFKIKLPLDKVDCRRRCPRGNDDLRNGRNDASTIAFDFYAGFTRYLLVYNNHIYIIPRKKICLFLVTEPRK